MAPSISEHSRRWRVYAEEAERRARRRLAFWLTGRRSRLRRSTRLLVAPTDLRAGDPFVAEEIYAGRFPLAGRVLLTEGASPFEIMLPSDEFARTLHSFRWLRHFRAANHELAFANARALTEDWMRMVGRAPDDAAWQDEVLARRVIAWLSHSTVVLKGADRGFYRRFLGSLSSQVLLLENLAATTPDGETRLRARIALAMATLALPARRPAIRSAARRLDAELDRQILPDGGHVSRSPKAVLDLLTDLLPLRQSYLNLGHGAPGRLVPAIDRMFPALRFFRHTGGELALFNGTTAVPAERLLSLLRHDETAGAPFRSLPHSRFQRLAAGTTTVVADTGPPPPANFSGGAHAGCLSFEMSAGGHRLIVNAGMPVFARADYAAFARSTAAHSTLVLGDTSSSRLSRSPFLGPLVAGGVRDVTTAVTVAEDGSRTLVSTHDGYLERFGLYHERRLRLSADGTVLNGNDRLHGRGEAQPGADAPQAVARFHVHPKVKVAPGGDGTIVLTSPDGRRWCFFCPDARPEILDDVFFADSAGPRPARQVALSFAVSAMPEIQWTLSRA